MRAKKQIVKAFYPESHSPLWIADNLARVGDDCNYMCKAHWEEKKKDDEEYRKSLEERGQKDYRRGNQFHQGDNSFEDYHKRMRENSKANQKSIKDWRIDSRYPDGSGGKLPEDMALCGHQFSKFYKIAWGSMDSELHHTIVTGFRENFTKRKQHGGDTEKEFRGDATYTQRWDEPLDAVINRFVDENKGYKIVMIEYSGGGWMDQEVNNQASALVVFEVDER